MLVYQRVFFYILIALVRCDMMIIHDVMIRAFAHAIHGDPFLNEREGGIKWNDLRCIPILKIHQWE